ncbi:MAG: ATP-binding cassette domain-containing protein [Acidimicrobiales bacterium]|nr:ATP-binding cassette domain-containing protein [Acidimicrobiales bacterium]
MSGTRLRHLWANPLAWLGALVLVYLAVPVIGFLIRLARASHPGFSTPGLFPALWVSVAGATISVALIALFGIPLAWVLARSRRRLAAVVGAAVYLPLAVPPLISGLLLVYLVGPYTWLGRTFDRRLTDSLAGVVIAQTFVAAPFLIVAARAAFSAEDHTLDEVAAALGHRPLARFFRVGLPGAGTGIRAGLLLSWLRAFGEYGATVLLAYHPSSLPIYTYVQFSGTGLANTVAPTALALGVAAGVVALGWIRLPRRPTPPGRRAPAVRPAAVEPVALAFDLDVLVGSFRLRAAHRSATHRLAVLGPSGSGKSVTLRSLAGLTSGPVGDVWYGPDLVSQTPVEERRIGYVPQGYHLLPHLDVWHQVCFGTDADPAVASYWLESFRLSSLTGRLPSELSGGQRQRVCLAQALARRPRVVLLDEPFSALDSPVRAELGRELRRFQRQSGLSTVLVTHDPEEAALLADEVVILLDGNVVQSGPPADVYTHPAGPDVARLLGIANIVAGRSAGPGRVRSGQLTLAVASNPAASGSAVLWCVHPEHIRVSATGGHPAEVLDVVDLGAATTLELDLGAGATITARTAEPGPWRPGDPCGVHVDPAAVTVWAAPRQPDPARRDRSDSDAPSAYDGLVGGA